MKITHVINDHNAALTAIKTAQIITKVNAYNIFLILLLEEIPNSTPVLNLLTNNTIMQMIYKIKKDSKEATV